jgi:hypothetical protein
MAVVSNGTTIIDNGAFDPAIPTGSLILIKSITASSSASIEFINGTNGVVLDGTYTSYVFKFIDIHSQNDNVAFQFNLSTDNGSNYNVAKTTTYFDSYHTEADSDAGIQYESPNDLAQGTGFQQIQKEQGNDNDQSISGTLQLFNPSSSVFVKHFLIRVNGMQHNDYAQDTFVAGYANTTSAINAVKFIMSSGNIDDGIIKLYGVK